MKTFEQFLEEQWVDSGELLTKLEPFEIEEIEELAQKYAKEYAQSVAEDLRERMSDEARLEPNGMLLQVDKQSILDTEIILP